MKHLSPNALQRHEQVSVVYSVVIDSGDETVLNDMLNPLYWQHHSNKLRGGDKVIVTTEDNKFYAELYVLESGNMSVKMRVLNAIALYDNKECKDAIKIEKGEKEVTPTQGYEVKWVSPTKKWGFRRIGQDGWTKTDFESKAAATAGTKEDLKAMAA